MKHVEMHIEGLIYTCLLCKHNTTNKHTMKVHIAHHNKFENAFALGNWKITNNKVITSLSNMDKDKLEEQISSMINKGESHFHGNRRGYKWICTVCGKVSMKRIHGVVHAETHIKGLSYSCSHCEYTSKTRGSIIHHFNKR